jgi:imidazolonepropionase-like amidohydrolase
MNVGINMKLFLLQLGSLLGMFFHVMPLFAQPLTESQGTSESLAFTGVNIVDTSTSEVIRNSTILVSDGKIVAIQPDIAAIPSKYKAHNLQGKWVVPGLSDGHIHLAQSGSAYTRPDIIDATQLRTYASDQAWLRANLPDLLSQYLRIGVTSVFDMGGPSSRLSHYAGLTRSNPTPTIYAAAELISPADVPELNIDGRTFISITNNQDALEAIEFQSNLSTHIAKFVWTNETGLNSQQIFDLYANAMDHAKKNGKVIAVHVEDLENAKMAIKAGADILVHGVITSIIDDEFINLAKKNHVAYMPTVSAFNHYRDIFSQEMRFSSHELSHSATEITKSFEMITQYKDKTGQLFQIFTKYMPYVDGKISMEPLSDEEQDIVSQIKRLFSKDIANIQKQNLIKAMKAGLLLAFGTDAGNPGTLHAASVQGEMLAWIDAGVPVPRLIKAMTIGNAQAFNLSHQMGSISKGKIASFAIFSESPLTDNFPKLIPELVVNSGNVIRFPNSEAKQ